ncbi:MAG: Lrp/AsnC ligand binding domain-containing protein, partial [Armatimonadetes bacterium]|nr:Lrp/AsnC ligand binding domain-containing protein [Armatimonadota bacterium]
MLETAYMLISLDRRTPAEVARAVRRVPGVVEAHVTLGNYDIVAVVSIEGTKGFSDVATYLKAVEG